MIKRLTHNLSIKIICVAAAAGLWAYVSASQSTIGKFPGSLQIRARNIPSDLTAKFDSHTVEIRIMAEPSVWRKLTSDSFSAYADLSEASTGTVSVPINVESSVAGVEIIERNPENILIALEPIISREVAISKKVEGNAGDGLTAGAISLTPDKATIKGAKSLIDTVSEVVSVINLNGESNNFSKIVAINAINDKGEIIEGIEFLPSEVSADIAIVKASNNKTVGIKVKTSGTPKSGYYVSSIQVDPSVVDVIGSRMILSEVNFVETYVIDLTDQSGDLNKEISLNLSDGIALQAGSPSRVGVKVTLSQSELTREFNIAVTPEGLENNLKVSSISPNQIRVLVTGPSDLLNSLKSAEISAPVDLKGKTSGILSFNLNQADIKLPSGFTVVSVLPSAVSVVIEPK